MSARHTFTGNPLDRAAAARRDPGWVAARLEDPATKFLLFGGLRPLLHLTDRGATIAWIRGPAEIGAEAAGPEFGEEAVLLGLDVGGAACFAVPTAAETDEPDSSGSKSFVDTRAAAALLPGTEAAIVAQARSLLSWHERHRYCACCGGPTRSVEAGWSRRCARSTCEADHFPRTDPVVIMVVERDDSILLGRSVRQPRYPAGLYSCLAGYIEPGESIEEAVRREVLEESGIEVGGVRYHSSQPWPFPSTLMIGCFASAESDRVRIDPEEVEEVRWFSREEVRTALERWNEPEGVRLPPPFTAAHGLIAAWLEQQARNAADGSTRETSR